MTDDQQLKPKKKVKIVSLYRPESGSTAINNTHTQSGPVNPVNVNGKRQIYIINAAKVPGVTGTPVILPSGNQPSRCIQLIPQSSPTPNQMLTNEITKQESLQRSSSYMEPTTASPIKAFRSRRDAILNDAQKRMANRHNTGFRPNQSVRSSFFLQKAIKEDESKSEDTSTVVRSRMPVSLIPTNFSIAILCKLDI
ncbi:unnamed protein product [Rodentolepis nana]|uniref:Uncharacterized protein n=1 Tax=Rodentolepis nana TaxID=102285 RepID=A0A0R3TML2_RODNA|nr:unnamed protein product [Rodentolepis nana]